MTDNENLVVEYRGFVDRVAMSIAKRLPEGSYDFEDLTSDGMVGMLEACENYDPEKGEFQTFAYLRIRGAIVDGLRSASLFPRQLYEVRKEFVDKTDKLVSELGRHPTHEEIADVVGMETEEYRVWCGRIVQMESHRDTEPDDFDNIPDGKDKFEEAEMKVDVSAALKEIPYRERYVLFATFWTGMTVEEIALALDIKPYRVRILRRSGMEKLKAQLGSYGE